MASTHSSVGFTLSFGQKLQQLARDISKRAPKDACSSRAYKRLSAAISFDPRFVIESVGPLLYKYRDQIFSSDERSAELFFLSNDFEAELASVDRDKADLAASLIPRLKDGARSLPPSEKTVFRSRVAELLDDYIEYLAAISGA